MYTLDLQYREHHGTKISNQELKRPERGAIASVIKEVIVWS